MKAPHTRRVKVVTYYAAWVALCGFVGGLVVAGVHTAGVAMATGADQWIVIFGDAATVAAIAAGQGLVALATGLVVHALGRTLRATVLLGLIVGGVDCGLYLLQMLVPATELGWGPDLAILAALVVLVTAAGSVRASAG